ncbi:MAG: biotin/lipoyl-binding protein, partial [Burkholderiales bacterium]
MASAPPQSTTSTNINARPTSRYKTALLIAAAVVLLAWAGHWLYQRATHVYIDDARIDGEVVTLSSRVSGWITELPVIEGDEVKKGQLL